MPETQETVTAEDIAWLEGQKNEWQSKADRFKQDGANMSGERAGNYADRYARILASVHPLAPLSDAETFGGLTREEVIELRDWFASRKSPTQNAQSHYLAALLTQQLGEKK